MILNAIFLIFYSVFILLVVKKTGCRLVTSGKLVMIVIELYFFFNFTSLLINLIRRSNNVLEAKERVDHIQFICNYLLNSLEF